MCSLNRKTQKRTEPIFYYFKLTTKVLYSNNCMRASWLETHYLIILCFKTNVKLLLLTTRANTLEMLSFSARMHITQVKP